MRADYDVPHPATDGDAGFKPAWRESAERFDTTPTRALYLWLDL
jgi:hypothetical protein